MRTLPVALSLLILVVYGFTAVLSPAQAQPADPAGQNDGVVITKYTEPSRKLELKFPIPGLIKEVAVKEGQVVKAGQLLMAQDNEVEALEWERLTAEAESPARLEAAEADLDVKRKVYERKSTAEGGVYAIAEIEEAGLDVTFREKQLEIARLDQRLNQIKAKQQGARVDRMTLESPIDGIVQKVEVWEGEMVDPQQDPAIIVVKNDPVYVTIKELKTHQVAQLKLGDTMEVKYPGESEWQQAKITYISPVADFATYTQEVRLELPNPQNRATGQPIEVRLPQNLVNLAQGQKTAANR